MKKATIFGKYLLLERINVGGMAEVFIAKAFGVEGFERILAIKKILPTMAEDEEFITMFIDEARISVQLNHANVVHIHELGKHAQSFYIAMEYVASRDLRTILEHYRKRKEIMPTAQAVFIASKMAEGLDYAHRKKDARGQELGIIHRDVSPQNILCSYEGEVKIIDFGIAKAANRSQKTQAGILKGKFGYMSPEQVRGLPIDRRSDVFALGVLLYEMLTGEKLFLGESDFSTLEKVRNAEVPLPSQFNPNVPPELEKVVLKALAREQEDRYQWASDLQEDLLRFLLAGEQIYSAKHLSSFMKETFAEELRREEEKMHRYAAIERPEQLEASGLLADQDGPDGRVNGDPESGSASPEGDASDKTQIVSEGHASQPLAAEGKTVVSGAPLMADSGSTPVEGTEDTQSSPKERNGHRGKVVIGEANGYVGETVVGPQPVRKTPGKPASNTLMLRQSAEDSTPVRAPRGPSRPASVITPAPKRRARTDDSLFRNVQVGPLAGLSQRARQWVLLGVGATLTLCLVALIWVLVLRSKPQSAILVTVTPPGAQVTVGGVAVTPGKVVDLNPGIYEVVATASGYIARKQRVAVPDSPDPVQVTVELSPEKKEDPARKVDAKPVEPPKPTADGAKEAAAQAEAQKAEAARAEAAKAEVAQAEAQKAETQRAEAEKAEAAKAKAEAARAADATAKAEAAAKAKALKEKAAAVVFVTEHDGVEISLDGKRVGTSPGVRLSDLKPGRQYAYSAKLSGFRLHTGRFEAPVSGELKLPVHLEREAAPETSKVTAVATKEVKREPDPTPDPSEEEKKGGAARGAMGMIACASEPMGAEVWVDGKRTGRTTPVSKAQPLQVPVGKRKIFFKFNGKQSATQTVDVTETETPVVRGKFD